MQSPIIIKATKDSFIAIDPIMGTTSYGLTYQEAIQNLWDASNLFDESLLEESIDKLN
jgi:predicted RNase H-like HicB family nuclease